MSIMTSSRSSNNPTETIAHIAKLAANIQETKQTISALRAAGHVTSDAEKHLEEMTNDLDSWKWNTY